MDNIENIQTTDTPQVATTVEAPQEAPAPGVMIDRTKGMTVVEVAAVAYAALNVNRGDADWNSLEESERRSLANLVAENLNNWRESRNTDEDMIQAVITALRPYLMAPEENPVVQTWNGSVNLQEATTWAEIPFSELRAGMIFKIESLYPGKFWAAASAAFIRYELLSAVFAINSVEAVVGGPAPVDPNDLTKGFTLTWKTKDDEASVEDTTATTEVQPAADAVTDVTYTEVTDDAQAQAVRDAAYEAVQQGELQAQGSVEAEAPAVTTGAPEAAE